MKKLKFLLAAISILPILNIDTAIAVRCESPYDFVQKVFSSSERTIEYRLDKSIQYREIKVVFFGKIDHVMRKNTTITLKSTEGVFSVPDQALIPPAQLWFNFLIRDSDDCKRWGLVNEIPIQGKGNLIGIDEPSGEGKAFYINKSN